jgi:hypothetical protein
VIILLTNPGRSNHYSFSIPQVISVNLDEWTYEEVNCLAETGGNSAVNAKYEAFYLKIKRQNTTVQRRSVMISLGTHQASSLSVLL